MEQRIFRLARAGGIDTNPTTFTQRAGTFASAATTLDERLGGPTPPEAKALAKEAL